MMSHTNPKERLEELRTELLFERISYSELVELQSLAEHIAPGDVELLEAAGVPERLPANNVGPAIGDRVILNDGVAWSAAGKTGTVIAMKPDALKPGRTLYTVEIDNPTPPAPGWPVTATLAVPAPAMFLLTPELEKRIKGLSQDELRAAICSITRAS